ncbi:MAG: glutathione S-transferase N-terminal domain-containing protein [Myxococcota bacterium]
MKTTDFSKDLAMLFERTGHAHHEAYIQVDGADEDWAVWYAGYLQQPLSHRLGRAFTRTEIILFLTELDHEIRARRPDVDWRDAYAEALIERYRAREQESLSLYHFAACPYCARVRNVIDELDAPVELRDIFENAVYRDELVAARGRPTVPVLRCDADGQSRWMPESADIIAHLRERFG